MLLTLFIRLSFVRPVQDGAIRGAAIQDKQGVLQVTSFRPFVQDGAVRGAGIQDKQGVR
jgi:hypothetical protein